MDGFGGGVEGCGDGNVVTTGHGGQREKFSYHQAFSKQCLDGTSTVGYTSI